MTISRKDQQIAGHRKHVSWGPESGRRKGFFKGNDWCMKTQKRQLIV